MLDVDLYKKHDKFILDVSFELEKGSLGILGPSGCGKTMILKSLAGIVNIDDGQIIFNDRILYSKEKKINLKPQQRKIGYLFQNYALFPNMNVEQNIACGITDLSKTEKDVKIKKMIRQFHLQGLEKRYPDELSGGQQQRVALARIFAYEPDVLLLDEPLSALDTVLKEDLKKELLEALNQYQGLTIMVSHDRDEIYQLCENLLVMDDGHIIQRGKTKDVFKKPDNIKSARLVGCHNISKIEIIDPNHVKCLDWNNIILEVEQINDDIKAIGVFGYNILPSFEKPLYNAIELKDHSIHDMPFVYSVMLDNGMVWMTSKMNIDSFYKLPLYLFIDKKSIILLK